VCVFAYHTISDAGWDVLGVLQDGNQAVVAALDKADLCISIGVQDAAFAQQITAASLHVPTALALDSAGAQQHRQPRATDAALGVPANRLRAALRCLHAPFS